MAAPAQFVSRSISLPFRIGPDGGIAFTTNPDEIAADQIRTLVLTYRGHRVMEPLYGTTVAAYVEDAMDESVLGTLELDLPDQLRAQLDPDIAVSTVSVSPDPNTPTLLNAVVQFQTSPVSVQQTSTVPLRLDS